MTIEDGLTQGRDDSVLAEWAAELADRIRGGEPFNPAELAREHPERAGALRHLLPAIALMAELASSSRRGNAAAAGWLPGDTLPPGLAESADCVVKRELGRGGMGVVYLAHNTLMGRDEVLKVMGRQVIERPGVLDRFLREIRAVARLRHPNIVAAYHARRLGESLVFAMEYVEGLDLSRLVKDRGPMPVAFACFCTRQAAVGLQNAHEAGLVHRDIKPGNLMLAREGNHATVKILDFGLAKVAREEKLDGELTHEGQALGTPDYMAPEQITDASSADIRADIYSLGCTLYYLLTGHPPFRANSLYDIYQAHISREADPLYLDRPEIPAALAALVAKMMAKDPARRFQTPDEVARALEPFVKKGDLAFKCPNAEIAGADRTTEGRAATEAFSAPIQGTTDAEEPVVLPGAAAAAPESRWEDLIEWRETEGANEATAGSALARRPPWVWPSVAALLLLFGFFAAWLGGVFKVKTPDGVIVLENVPKDAEILVDGSRITFTWPGAGKPLEIRAVPGQRKVEVKRDGFRTFGEVVTVKTDESEEITVRLEPLVVARPEKEPVPAVDRQGWTSLFNGKDLSGWFIDSGTGNWRVEDGNLVYTRSGGYWTAGFLLSDRAFSDFRLRFEFQPASRSDSGVTFRALPGEFAGRLAHPLQVQFGDRTGSVKYGSFYWSTNADEVLPPDSPAQLKPAGSWNTMEVEVQADSLRVTINGKDVLITDLGKLADRPEANPALKRRSGRIGFQSHTGTVRFRNIEIKELNQGADVLSDAARVPKQREARVDAARRMVKLRPEDPQAHKKLGDALLAQGTTKAVEAAEYAYREAIRLRPDDSATHFYLAEALKRLGLFDEALPEYREAIRLGPEDNRFAYSQLVDILAGAADLRLRNPVEALEHARKGIEITHGMEPYFWRVLAFAEYRAGHWEEALAALEKNKTLGGSEYAGTWFLLSLIHAQRGDKDQARPWYDKAVARMKETRGGDDSAARLLWAEADKLLGQPGPKAMESNTLHRDAVARANSAYKLRQQGLLDEAVAAARDAIRLDPDLALAHQNLGSALLAKKDWVGAIAAYREAIRLEPDDPVNHRELALALQGKGMPEEAIEELRAVVRLRPLGFDSHNRLHHALRDQGRLDELVAAYRETLRLIPNHPAFLHRLSWTLSNAADPLRRKPGEALELSLRATRLSPDDGSYRLGLALAEYRLGHWKTSLAAIEQSRKLHDGADGSGEIFACLLRALVLAKEGDADQAHTWFAKAVSVLKADEPDTDALRRLQFWRMGDNPVRLKLWAEAAELLGEPGPYAQLPGDGPPRPPIAEVAPK